jgi:SH3 domain protein
MMKKIILYIVFCMLLLPPAVQAKTMYVIDYFKIMVRSQPGEGFKIVNQLSSNEKVRLLTTEGTWAKVAFRDNKTGWVLRRFITDETPKAIRIAELEKELEENAQKLALLDEETLSLKKRDVEMGEQVNVMSAENQRLKEEPFRILMLLAGGGIFLVGCITTLILQSMGRKKRGGSLGFDKGIGL